MTMLKSGIKVELSETTSCRPAAHFGRQIGPLTSLRFVAAFFVVLYHTMPRHEPDGWLTRLGASFIDLGFTAVGLFFVLSGFILTTVYPELNNRATVLRFYIARLARIYPMYVLSLLIDLPRLLIWRIVKYGIVGGTLLTGGTFVAQLAMVQAWLPQFGGLNFPSWSVATEAFFYIAFPLLLPVLLRPRNLAIDGLVLGLLWGAGIAWGFYVLYHPQSSIVGPINDHNPILRLPEFAAGILIAKIRHAALAAGQAPSRLWGRSSILGMIGIGVIVVMEPWIGNSSLKSGLLVPFYSCLILGLALVGGRVEKALSAAPLMVLGEASYALYLIHAPVWAWFQAVDFGHIVPVYIIYLATVIGASIALHLYFERPMRQMVLALPYFSRCPQSLPVNK